MKYFVVTILCGFIGSYCNPPIAKRTVNNPKPDSFVVEAKGSKRIIEKKADSADSTPVVNTTNGRVLNAADKQQIDWLIPEDAEIVIIEELLPETRQYAQSLYGYILTRSPFGIERRKTEKIPVDSIPTQRFYINFIGDHRYEVRVFNSYEH